MDVIVCNHSLPVVPKRHTSHETVGLELYVCQYISRLFLCFHFKVNISAIIGWKFCTVIYGSQIMHHGDFVDLLTFELHWQVDIFGLKSNVYTIIF